MKYALYAITGVIIVTLIYVGSVMRNQEKSGNDLQVEEQTNLMQGNWETQTDNQSPVVIKITPVELGKDAEVWRFRIVFDTHSGDLDDDLLSMVSLIGDDGSVYKPTAWEGSEPGGHHREGVLVFKAIQPAPVFIELKVTNVGGILERLFKWKI